MKGLRIRVSSGGWSPHSNLCSALATTRATARAGRKTSFGQVSLQRQLVSRARQPGRTKNGRRSCRTRGERARPSASASRILIACSSTRGSTWGGSTAPVPVAVPGEHAPVPGWTYGSTRKYLWQYPAHHFGGAHHFDGAASYCPFGHQTDHHR